MFIEKLKFESNEEERTFIMKNLMVTDLYLK